MTIFLIRHAQSQFNAVYQAGQPDPLLFDARLSKLGHQQGQIARATTSKLPIDRVVVSPLTRTLQTASLLFGSDRTFEIDAVVREQVLNSCDIGRSPSQLSKEYPHLDFAHLPDHWWHKDVPDHRGIPVEPNDVLQRRADLFSKHLRDSAARNTAVVTHGNFIRALTGIQPENCQVIEFEPY
ncbi:MAG: histidine phosphatase family protein [Rhizobiaceae bacterium]